MTTNAITKTITATTSELPMVQNYIEHCIPPGERKEWKVNITEARTIEYREKK